MMPAVDDVPDVDFHTDDDDLTTIQGNITTFLRRRVEAAGADGVVVCMSGGVDSTVTATLCVDALGPERVTALVLPCGLADAANTIDADEVGGELGLSPTTIQLRPVLDMFEDVVAPAVDADADRVAIGNATARLRMAVAYYAANVTERLVCGTSNRTETLLGYYTKYGDGAADLRPIAGLYKIEVRALARHLEVPSAIVEKPSTAGLWAGQTDADDLGAPYELIDVILYRLLEADLGVAAVADELGIDESVVARYADRVLAHEHKRTPVATPDVGRADPSDTFFALEDQA